MSCHELGSLPIHFDCSTITVAAAVVVGLQEQNSDLSKNTSMAECGKLHARNEHAIAFVSTSLLAKDEGAFALLLLLSKDGPRDSFKNNEKVVGYR